MAEAGKTSISSLPSSRMRLPVPRGGLPTDAIASRESAVRRAARIVITGPPIHSSPAAGAPGSRPLARQAAADQSGATSARRLMHSRSSTDFARGASLAKAVLFRATSSTARSSSRPVVDRPLAVDPVITGWTLEVVVVAAAPVLTGTAAAEVIVAAAEVIVALRAHGREARHQASQLLFPAVRARRIRRRETREQRGRALATGFAAVLVDGHRPYLG